MASHMMLFWVYKMIFLSLLQIKNKHLKFIEFRIERIDTKEHSSTSK